MGARIVCVAFLEEALLSKRHEIAELKEIVSRQPCTFEEFETRKQKVEALKHELGLQAEKIEKRMEIIDNFDYKLTSAKQNVTYLLICDFLDRYYFAFSLTEQFSIKI